jgi:hypothetical protein
VISQALGDGFAFTVALAREIDGYMFRVWHSIRNDPEAFTFTFTDQNAKDTHRPSAAFHGVTMPGQICANQAAIIAGK